MDFIKGFEWQLIETGIVIVFHIILRSIFYSMIDRVGEKLYYHVPRRKLTKKIISVVLSFISIGFIFFIWGVDQSELLYFISSLLTVLGVAFFAQWSIMSNITATLIIFFNHPAKIGDTISILDKDFQVEGTISDIGVFFMLIKTKEGDQISIPSNVFLQIMVRHDKDNTLKTSVKTQEV
jgi:small-conductance mechanosensitive channel